MRYKTFTKPIAVLRSRAALRSRKFLLIRLRNDKQFCHPAYTDNRVILTLDTYQEEGKTLWQEMPLSNTKCLKILSTRIFFLITWRYVSMYVVVNNSIVIAAHKCLIIEALFFGERALPCFPFQKKKTVQGFRCGFLSIIIIFIIIYTYVCVCVCACVCFGFWSSLTIKNTWH